jgi:coenzyme F420-reducing hydrogenase gamma subunit
MKPKVAFFDFAGCEGCELQIANLEESVTDITKLIDIVSFREVMKNQSDDYDIAFVEGSIARPMDEERIRKIREKAKILIALGACAHLGGVQRLGNKYLVEENKKLVYDRAKSEDISDVNPFFNKPRHRSLDEIVQVDYVIPGCPINKIEFAKVIVALLTGKKPPIPDYPVCVECKKKENACLFTIGGVCMGPVARGGCDALCPTYGNECEACRGYISHPHEKAQLDVLTKYGLSLEEIMNRRTMFTSRYTESKKEISE